MSDTLYISKINLPDGNEYQVKDLGARSLIADLQAYSDYLGVTTTALTDGSTTNPVTIAGESVTAVKGNIVNYGSKEFIWSGSLWQEFGDLSALGDLAYEDTAAVTGTAAAQTFTGTEATISSTLSGGTAQTVGTALGDATTATIAEFDNAGSVTAGSAASFTQGTDSFTQGEDTFTQGTDSFTQGTDTFTATVSNEVLTLDFSQGSDSFTQGEDSFTQGSDTFSQGSDSFTANTPTAVTLPTSKDTTVVTAQGTLSTTSITIPTTGTATYTPAGTNGTSSVTGTAAPAGE